MANLTFDSPFIFLTALQGCVPSVLASTKELPETQPCKAFRYVNRRPGHQFNL